jgi:hypothetical protein
MEPDFGGYATRAGLKCSDGRIIRPEAFQHMDGKTVPLVYMHGHKDVGNLLGKAVLEARSDGVYAYGYFNNSPNADIAKNAVAHGDIESLSIYANGLKEMNKIVSHGSIREVSLVLSGANPGAKIDHVRIQHSDDPDDVTELEDVAIIHSGLGIDLPEGDASEEEDEVQHAEQPKGESVKDIYNQLNEKQKNVVHLMIGAALEEAESGNAEHSDTDTTVITGEVVDDAAGSDDTTDTTDDTGIAHEEGSETMTRNTFENNETVGGTGGSRKGPTISHSDVQSIFEHGKEIKSFRKAVQHFLDEKGIAPDASALAHGITNIEVLFPDARAISSTPEFEKRRTEWVSSVMSETHKTPFAKIKTLSADITQDDARAKGYIKGNYKAEEWFGVTKRTTSPTTVYKKQKLDRDDILDITDFDVVAWLMAEMRLMLEEEVGRAVLISDGRAVEHEDKIKDPLGASDGTGIRSILNDHELYVTTLNVNVADANSNYEEIVDAVMDGMEFYKGTGTPTFYTTVRQLNKFKKAKDAQGRRYYNNNAEVAEALGVKRIVTVEPMVEVAGLVGIIVNLQDYNLGTNAGGEITSFDDFDIDYNQYKYLMETRLSGALTKIKSALVIRETSEDSVLLVPQKPTFVASTGVITIPTVTGVVYKDAAGTTLSAGAQTALAAGAEKWVYAYTTGDYHFASTAEDSWRFKRDPA